MKLPRGIKKPKITWFSYDAVLSADVAFVDVPRCDIRFVVSVLVSTYGTYPIGVHFSLFVLFAEDVVEVVTIFLAIHVAG